MKNLKVVKVNSEFIQFENNIKLYSEHIEQCCEHHYLSFNDLTIEDFDNLEFDLTNDNFFERLEGYGIALKPLKGYPIRIPGYGANNGNYSSDLTLYITNDNDFTKTYDITECQSECQDYND